MPVSLMVLVAAGVMIACGIYLMLERTLTRILLGFVLAGNGVNLLFLVAAGPPGLPPFEGTADPSEMSDPLPFAMVLTAIVIALGIAAFVVALAYRAWQLFGHDEVPDDVEDRRVLRRGRRQGEGSVRKAGPPLSEDHRRGALEAAQSPDGAVDGTSDGPADRSGAPDDARGADDADGMDGARGADGMADADGMDDADDADGMDDAEALGEDLSSDDDAPMDRTESDEGEDADPADPADPAGSAEPDRTDPDRTDPGPRSAR